MKTDPYIIAEIGSNWFKSDNEINNIKCALEQINLAADAGASAVKFQLFTPYEIFGPKGVSKKMACLPKKSVESLARHAWRCDIDFMCSAFSIEGYKFVDKYVDIHKVASPEVLHPGIVSWCLAQKKPVIYSDGCQVIKLRRPQDIVMRCVSKYPALAEEYDLQGTKIGEWGVSDHTYDKGVSVLARKLGAKYFEKHVDFMPDIGNPTDDSEVSIGPGEFQMYVESIKNAKTLYNIKHECAKKYGRRYTEDGWYRPL